MSSLSSKEHLSFQSGECLICPFTRIPTVREKSVKNEKSSRSGKSQGNLSESGKFEILEKVREKSGNFITTT